jgi:hypothetical protein
VSIFGLKQSTRPGTSRGGSRICSWAKNRPPISPGPKAPERAAALRDALALFHDWDFRNDPWVHDFGALELFGARLFFKINYYHPENDTLAPVPSNSYLCRRVLTLMRADEY